MESFEAGKDPLLVDELIRQAEDQKGKWKMPGNEPAPSYREWQDILDNRPAPPGM